MFIGIKWRSSSITSQIQPGTSKLWPLNFLKIGLEGRFRSITQIVFIQSEPNFQKMFIGIKWRSSSITSQIQPGTLKLWPLNFLKIGLEGRFRSITQIVFIQSPPNFQKMFIGIKWRSSSITSQIQPGTLKLWPLNFLKIGLEGRFRSITQIVFIQSPPNFQKMFIGIKWRSSSITSQIQPGTLKLWPLNFLKIGLEFRFRSITQIVFIQSPPNFQKMFIGIKWRSSSITSQIQPGTLKLWPLNFLKIGLEGRFRSITQIVFNQSPPNFQKMLIGIKWRSSSITSQIQPGILKLWPLNFLKIGLEGRFRSITQIVFIQSEPNFQKMFIGIKWRSSSITSQLQPGTLKLWPLNLLKIGLEGRFRSITQMVFIQSPPNFQKMFIGIKWRPSSITSQIQPGTLKLWPLNLLKIVLEGRFRSITQIVFIQSEPNFQKMFIGIKWRSSLITSQIQPGTLKLWPLNFLKIGLEGGFRSIIQIVFIQSPPNFQKMFIGITWRISSITS